MVILDFRLEIVSRSWHTYIVGKYWGKVRRDSCCSVIRARGVFRLSEIFLYSCRTKNSPTHAIFMSYSYKNDKLDMSIRDIISVVRIRCILCCSLAAKNWSLQTINLGARRLFY